MINEKKYLFSLWAPVVFYMALIFLLSSMQFDFSFFRNAQKNHGDWLAHIVEYCVFGYLLSRAFGFGKPNLFFWVLLTGALYGASDEFHQSYVPHRDCSIYDLMADCVGLSLGYWVWKFKNRKVQTINA